MKKILLFELCLLLLATNFQSDNPPGWYQQTLPVNDFVNDIFFIDTLTGWVVTQGHTNNQDTAYIMKTTNGGDNWTVQYSRNMNLTTVHFTDQQTGYVGGGSGSGTLYLLKTTNGGDNWTEIIGTFAQGISVSDLFFINSDTGWICDKDDLFGLGLLKTTNGGINWVQQLDQSYSPYRLSFINSDTGWMGNNHEKLYRTTNGGMNWSLQYMNNIPIISLFFINGTHGWMRGGTTNGVIYTTDGGFNWINSQGENSGYDVKFITFDIGFSGGGNEPLRITKSTDGGKTWGYQSAQATPDLSIAIIKDDTNNIWAGRQLLIHTTDGGGPIIYTNIQQIGSELPTDFKLYQNYPNPFNPETTIEFELNKISDVSIQIFDISGRTIGGAGYTNKSPGRYKFIYNAEDLSTGIYFYRLIASGIIIDTKKMILIK